MCYKNKIVYFIYELQDGWRIHHLRYSCECVESLSELCNSIIILKDRSCWRRGGFSYTKRVLKHLLPQDSYTSNYQTFAISIITDIKVLSSVLLEYLCWYRIIVSFSDIVFVTSTLFFRLI